MYLTFDDGPHETATPFVLDQLAHYQAKASFFCIGKNVQAHPDIYQRILKEGHAVGNHTHNHLNGWKTANAAYLADIEQAGKYIDSRLFRPPYGRMRRSQWQQLQQQQPGMQAIMWDVLSADFDTRLTWEACAAYVCYHTSPGSIVLFHDSAKAWDRMHLALPKVLEHFSKVGWKFKAIP